MLIRIFLPIVSFAIMLMFFELGSAIITVLFIGLLMLPGANLVIAAAILCAAAYVTFDGLNIAWLILFAGISGLVNYFYKPNGTNIVVIDEFDDLATEHHKPVDYY